MLDLSSENQGTLLLVDDEVNIVNSLKRIFLPLNYSVLTAYNGAEGLDILRKNDVDIIISDMRMPEMDGATFLKKAASQWPEISRILLTGYADINSAIASINEGQIDYYLHKPWQTAELLKIIQNLMEKRLLIEENKQLYQKLSVKNEELIFLNNNLEELLKERTLKLEHSNDHAKQAYSSVIQILSTLSEQHEGNFKGHYQNVANLSKQLAQHLGLSEEEVQVIYTAGLVHGIGKTGFPDSIIRTPYTQLNAEDKLKFEQYPLLGSTILMSFPPLEKVATLVSSHRELINGEGYPNKLAGDAIPLGAQILSIVVDFHELQTGLLDVQNLSISEAMDIIRSNLNQRYDKMLVEFLTTVVSSYSDEILQSEECVLTPLQLKPGMVLARDLVSHSGLILLHKGQVLTEQTIATFNHIGKITLHITQESITDE